MKHKMFSVFDVKAMCYLPPFCLPETGMALRVFGDCVNSSDHQFGKHPGDYTLFELGSFDDSVCVVSCTPSAVKVVNGLEVVRVVDFSAEGNQQVLDLKARFEADGEDSHETA